MIRVLGSVQHARSRLNQFPAVTHQKSRQAYLTDEHDGPLNKFVHNTTAGALTIAEHLALLMLLGRRFAARIDRSGARILAYRQYGDGMYLEALRDIFHAHAGPKQKTARLMGGFSGARCLTPFSAATNLHVAAVSSEACGTGGWLRPVRGHASRSAFHSGHEVSSRERCPRAASSSSAP